MLSSPTAQFLENESLSTVLSVELSTVPKVESVFELSFKYRTHRAYQTLKNIFASDVLSCKCSFSRTAISTQRIGADYSDSAVTPFTSQVAVNLINRVHLLCVDIINVLIVLSYRKLSH